jgi:hypothetical protein
MCVRYHNLPQEFTELLGFTSTAAEAAPVPKADISQSQTDMCMVIAWMAMSPYVLYGDC